MKLSSNTMSSLFSAALCVFFLAASPSMAQEKTSISTTPSSNALPQDSLYWLSLPLIDDRGTHFDFKDLAGHPILVTMFYSDCNSACPIIIESLQRTVSALNPAEGKLTVLMVSLNPRTDTAESLAALAKMHNLDPKFFRLAVSNNDSNTRTLAAALNIKYRILINGEISHNTRISLLDATGKVVAYSTQLSTAADQEFLEKIKQQLK